MGENTFSAIIIDWEGGRTKKAQFEVICQACNNRRFGGWVYYNNGNVASFHASFTNKSSHTTTTSGRFLCFSPPPTIKEFNFLEGCLEKLTGLKY